MFSRGGQCLNLSEPLYTANYDDASVLHRRKMFERVDPPEDGSSADAWVCFIRVLTNPNTRARIDVRIAGYYLGGEDKERVRSALDSVEEELEELIVETARGLTDKYVQLTDMYNRELTAEDPTLLTNTPEATQSPKLTLCFSGFSQRDDRNGDDERLFVIEDLWDCVNMIAVTRDARVYVKTEYVEPYPRRHRSNDAARALARAMRDAGYRVDESEDTGARSKALRDAAREQVAVLGAVVAVKLTAALEK